jgi:hypothetical protein
VVVVVVGVAVFLLSAACATSGRGGLRGGFDADTAVQPFVLIGLGRRDE